MGFDWDKVLLSSSKFSVSAGKQKHRRNIVATATKLTDSPVKSSKSDELGNLKHQNGGKHFAGLESARVRSKNSRNLNVNTHIALIDNKVSLNLGVKGNAFSNLIYVPSSHCDSRKRPTHCESTLSSEENPKSARTDNSKTPVSIGTRTFVNESWATSHVGVLAPRESLSFGNIYKASKTSISDSKNALVYDNLFTPKRSNNNVLGFGGCNYGHGSIIKGVKKVENITSKCEIIGNKKIIVEELNRAGNEKYRRGCFMEAISFYNKAIELCPQNAACHSNKAAALAGLGKFTEAVGESLEAIKCDPSYSRAYYRLGTLYTRLGQVEDAKWHFKLSGHDLGSETMQRLVHLEAHLTNMKKAQEDENWDRALEESTLSIEAGADASNQVVAVKAEALLKLHRPNEVVELLIATRNSAESRSRKHCKGTSLLLILETQAYLCHGRFEKGVVAAEQAVNLDPNSKSLMWLKIATCVADARKSGNEHFKAGKYLKACAMYGKGLQYDPTNSVLLCNRAACRSELGQWQMAIDDCNAALRNQPNYSKSLLRRAHSNAKLERWEESLRDYLALRKAMPQDQTIHNSLVEVQMKQRRAQG
uniref:Putative TPR repeat-containing thioredoxin TTL1-like n=1 Tax=Davidia involucrata TaxID=16924 RepID=A0A5B6ZRW1_DAVIN